jgi:amino acid adenylation domain-containing protein
MITALVEQLRDRGIRLSTEGGELRYHGPVGAMTPELVSHLKQHKQELIVHLTRARSKPIVHVPDQSDYEVSNAQRRIWLLSQIEAASAAYNIPLRLLLEGPIAYGALHQALGSVEARHEALRTTIVVVDGAPRQIVHPPGATGFRLREIDFASEADPHARMYDFAVSDAAEPFDLERGPLLRAALLQIGPEQHMLCLTAHHLVCDGWSLRVVMQDLTAFYEAALAGTVARLDPLPVQCRDYAVWENEALAGPEWLARRDYWLSKLAGELPVLDLPRDAPRPDFQSFSGDVYGVSFDAHEAERLAAFAQSRRCSVFTVFLTLVKVLLHRYTGQRDVIVGTAVAGRGQIELEPQVGCYINTLPLRSRIEPSSSFDSILRQVRQTVLEALDHQDYPFDHLIDALRQPRDFSRSPVFDVMMVSQTAADLNTTMGGVRISHLPLNSRVSKYDLTFDCEEAPGFIHIAIEYASDLFTRARIERMGEHLRTLALDAIERPEAPIRALTMLRTGEWDAVIRRYNRTDAGVVSDTVVERTARTARRLPDRIAVVCGEERWTYAQLHGRALAIAGALRADRVGPGDVVGVLVQRSPDLVAALLGVLLTGAAYLPLDGIYPPERLAAMIEDCGARVIVCDAASRLLAPAIEIPMLGLDAQLPRAEPPAALPALTDLAYVICTSGSTGRPKSVQVPHAALANFLASMQRAPGLGEQDVLLALTTVCFDIAALELFLPLCVGARLVIAPPQTAMDAEALRCLIERERITVLQATPAGWRTLLESGWSSPGLRALCGGEALAADLAAQLADRTGEVWNLYGPTETTVWSAARRLARPKAAPTRVFSAEPIGEPIANTQLYSLDAWLTPMPIGVAGELYIGGSGVAWGYRGRPALTAEKFLPDPFSTTPGARMYRTGDLIRSADDGTFEFLGRSDQQVKVRGFRIELGEIETALAAHPDVAEAVVTTRAEDTILAAYLVARPGREPTGLRDFLARRLPNYMLPSIFVQLEQLPLTPNGKVDRRALPVPSETRAPARVSPRTPTERRVAELWETLLGVADPSIYQSFFELGGHSLRAVKLLAATKREFGVSIPLRAFFAEPTIAWLAEAVASSTPARTPAGPRIGKATPLPPIERDAPGDVAPSALSNSVLS